jgi:hypothetical protein
MAQRGRRGSKLSLVPLCGLHEHERPKPPGDLSPAEAETWHNCVWAMKPGWANPETEILIKLYCTHVMRHLSERLFSVVRLLPGGELPLALGARDGDAERFH